MGSHLISRRPTGDCGFTLIEVLVAIALTAIVLTAATASFITHLKANHQGEIVFDGAQAAQTVIDELRYAEIDTLPTTGSDSPRRVTINSLRDYDVTVSYCTTSSYCSSDDVRQLVVDVKHKGQTVYSTETIFTSLEKGYGESVGGEESSSSSSSSSSTSSSSSSTSSSSTSSTSSSSSTSSTSSSSSSTSTSSSSTSSSASSSSSSSSGSRRRRRRRCRTWRC